MKKSIQTIMFEEHEKLDKIFNEFETILKKDLSQSKEIFYKFKWTLEKHFFIEEKVIFTVYSEGSDDEREDILTLLKEHKDILYLLEKIEDDLDDNLASDLTDFSNILLSHAKFENEVFYPKLDDELSDNQKSLIFERANEKIHG